MNQIRSRLLSPQPTIALAGSDAEISMGELKKQFIEIKASSVSKETGEGTADVSIIENEKRASGKLTTGAFRLAKLLTGDIAIRFIFKEAKIDSPAIPHVARRVLADLD